MKLSFRCISSTHLANMHSIDWSCYWIYNRLVYLPQGACSLIQSIALSYPFKLALKNKSHERVGKNGNQCPILFRRTNIFLVMFAFFPWFNFHPYVHAYKWYSCFLASTNSSECECCDFVSYKHKYVNY